MACAAARHAAATAVDRNASGRSRRVHHASRGVEITAASAGPAVLPKFGYIVRCNLTHSEGSYRIFAGNSIRCATAAVIVKAVDINEKRQRFRPKLPALSRVVFMVFIAHSSGGPVLNGKLEFLGVGALPVAASTVGPAVEGWFESGIRNYSTLVSIGVLVVLS